MQQVAVARLGRCQEHEPWQVLRHADLCPRGPHLGVLVSKIERKRATDDRLDAGPRQLVGELQCPEHIVGIGQSRRGLAIGLGESCNPGNRQCAFQQRIGRMQVKVDEARCHCPVLLCSDRVLPKRGFAYLIHPMRRQIADPNRYCGWPPADRTVRERDRKPRLTSGYSGSSACYPLWWQPAQSNCAVFPAGLHGATSKPPNRQRGGCRGFSFTARKAPAPTPRSLK